MENSQEMPLTYEHVIGELYVENVVLKREARRAQASIESLTQQLEAKSESSEPPVLLTEVTPRPPNGTAPPETASEPVAAGT